MAVTIQGGFYLNAAGVAHDANGKELPGTDAKKVKKLQEEQERAAQTAVVEQAAQAQLVTDQAAEIAALKAQLAAAPKAK